MKQISSSLRRRPPTAHWTATGTVRETRWGPATITRGARRARWRCGRHCPRRHLTFRRSGARAGGVSVRHCVASLLNAFGAALLWHTVAQRSARAASARSWFAGARCREEKSQSQHW